MRALRKRIRTDFKAALAAAAALLLLFGASGCFLLGSPGMDNEDGQSGSNAVRTAPAQTPSPTEVAADNPVFVLFNEYFDSWSAAANGLLLSVASGGDADMAFLYSEMSSSEAELALIYATVGMFAPDGAGFSGSFTETYAGSGTMSSRGVFEYDLENGQVILGRVEDGCLRASFGTRTEETASTPSPAPTAAPEETEEATDEPEETSEPSQSPEVTQEPGYTPEPTAEPTPEPTPDETFSEQARCVLKRTENGWIAAVIRGGKVSVTELVNGELYFISEAIDALPEEYEPENGVAAILDGIGCAVLKYANGAAVLLKP